MNKSKTIALGLGIIGRGIVFKLMQSSRGKFHRDASLKPAAFPNLIMIAIKRMQMGVKAQ